VSGFGDKCEIRVFYCRNLGEGTGAPAALSCLAREQGLVLEPVPCSGKLDPRYLLRAFEAGARAVCVLTCPNDQCKLIEGNVRAARRVTAVKELLSEAGLDPESLRLVRPDGAGDENLEAAVRSIASFVGNR